MSLRKPPPPRKDRSAEFAGYTPRARAPAIGSQEMEYVLAGIAEWGKTAREPAAKVRGRKRQDIRDSARGEECLVRLPGCPGDSSMTIWSHAPLGAAGKGKGIKAVDAAGAYCCTYCDSIVDGQRPLPEGCTRASVLLDWFMGHMRSLVVLAQKGLL
jgi:hypothetical protein